MPAKQNTLQARLDAALEEPRIRNQVLESSALLGREGMLSPLQCAILDHGRFCGFIGFEDCQLGRCRTKSQIKSLLMISKMLSTFLLKRRLWERLGLREGNALR